jgi:hypothetical protein
MSSKRQQFVIRYFQEECRQAPMSILRAAVLTGLIHCLSAADSLELLIRGDVKDERLRERLVARLYECVDLELENPSHLLVKLLSLLPTTPYPRKNSFAYLLQRLYWSMPLRQRRTIVKTFLNSKELGMRRRAYKLMQEDWSPSWILNLERSWYEWHDQQCACMVVDHFETIFLMNNIDELARDLNDGAYLSRLYIRVVPVKPTLLKNLRKVDGITYAYVAARLRKRISRKEARNLLQQYEHDSRLGILAWSLGKLGHWDLLTDLASNISDIETRRRRRQYEEWGMTEYFVDRIHESN